MVHLYDEVNLDAMLEFPDVVPSAGPSAELIMADTNLVCIVNVPAFLIPGDILKFFASYVAKMRVFNVYRHYSSPEVYLAVLEMESSVAANDIIRDFHGQQLTSLEPTVCIMLAVKSISHDINNNSSTSSAATCTEGNGVWSDESCCCDETTAGDDEIRPAKDGSEAIGAQSDGVTRDAEDTLQRAASPLTRHTTRTLLPSRGENCPLCLDKLDEAACFTTCCNHSFHISCISQLEGSQCPVCRFHHDAIQELSCCSSCGWQGGEAGDLWVCLVCGYVGCGRSHCFHIRDHYVECMHTYSMNVTNRSVWDFAGGGFVHRLILQRPEVESETDPGANSPGRGRSSTMSVSSSRRGNVDEMQVVNRSRSLSPRRPLLSSQAGRAWRDLDGRSDELGPGAPLDSARTSELKIFEVSEPAYRHRTRHQHPRLTSEQEELLVNSKLEIAANHYTQLVTWQLQQHREQYEARLTRIQENALKEREDRAAAGGSGSGTKNGHRAAAGADAGAGAGATKSSSATWAQKILQSLVVEKAKVLRQVEAGRARLAAARTELDVLGRLGSSLQSNTAEWSKRVESALANLTAAELVYREGVPKLENRVRELMLEMDGATEGAVKDRSVSVKGRRRDTHSGTGAEGDEDRDACGDGGGKSS